MFHRFKILGNGYRWDGNSLILILSRRIQVILDGKANLFINTLEVQVFTDLLRFNPLSGSVFFVKRFQKRAIEETLSVLKVCLPPNRKCSESAADRVSSPPLNYERLAPPMERITARICSIQLGTYSNYSARGILGYLSGPGILLSEDPICGVTEYLQDALILHIARVHNTR
ncbi:hypothetical protein AVEN_252218-1 [Araneus ventricosus]|uniref:Uncharacterized protein n=1 Tax=Araneus ventricosus TaxID=182803 RepID=A0A4Y2PKP0_ARAVE|nr:hypothetical protein AVEN_252218-1 [Araneus ventricosus]